jgi:hypothetical protein
VSRPTSAGLFHPIYQIKRRRWFVTCADDSPKANADVVFQALGNEDCRAIVRALSKPTTAGEISDTTAVPRSTTYRKLETLTEAGLPVESALITAGMFVIVDLLYR